MSVMLMPNVLREKELVVGSVLQSVPQAEPNGKDGTWHVSDGPITDYDQSGDDFVLESQVRHFLSLVLSSAGV